MNLVQVHVSGPIPPAVLSDPDDDEILVCAIAAEARFIVFGDRHLLSLKTFPEISIVSTADAMRIIDSV